jgi:hypothetical protein
LIFRLDFLCKASIAVINALTRAILSPHSGLQAVQAPTFRWGGHLKENLMSKIKQKPAIEPINIVIGKSKVKGAPAPSATKQDAVISLLKRPKGATLKELMEATGWQRHSVHGMLSGAIKKRLRLPLISTKEVRGQVYKIAATTTAA